MRKLMLAGLAAVVALAFGGNAVAAQKLKFAHNYPIAHPYHTAAVWGVAEIKKQTAGRYDIEIFPDAVLGKEQANLEGLSLGTVDMMYLGLTYAANIEPTIAVAIAPFIYRNFDHWLKFSQSDVFKELSNGWKKKSGHEVMSLAYYGQRHVTSNKPINKPEDMKGLKIRVPGGKLMLMFPNAVGANPTPMAFHEVYMALQQGAVDAQENPLPTIQTMKFYEVQKYINLTGHISDCHLITVAGRVWKKIPEADQKVFRDVFAQVAKKASLEIAQAEKDLIGWFRAQGNIVNEVDRKPFAAAVAKVVNGPDAMWPKAMYDKVVAVK